MKRLKRAVLVSLCLMISVLTFAGCEKTPAEESAENKTAIQENQVAAVESFTENFASQLTQVNYSDFQSSVDSGQISGLFYLDFAQRWKTFSEKHGEIKDTKVIETSKTDTGYSSKIVLTGEDQQMMALTIVYNVSMTPISTDIEDYTDDTTVTIGSKMESAGINIVVGLGIVFLILIFLSIVISLFKYINKAGDKKTAEAPVSQKTAPAALAASPAVVSSASPAQNNLELVAVITAAIAASEGATSTDGFVVRSIRRLDSNKWR